MTSASYHSLAISLGLAGGPGRRPVAPSALSYSRPKWGRARAQTDGRIMF